jgi:hypothetical protein
VSAILHIVHAKQLCFDMEKRELPPPAPPPAAETPLHLNLPTLAPAMYLIFNSLPPNPTRSHCIRAAPAIKVNQSKSKLLQAGSGMDCGLSTVLGGVPAKCAGANSARMTEVVLHVRPVDSSFPAGDSSQFKPKKVYALQPKATTDNEPRTTDKPKIKLSQTISRYFYTPPGRGGPGKGTRQSDLIRVNPT